MQGGYNSPNAARAWAYLTSIAVIRFFLPLRSRTHPFVKLENPLGLDADIPDHPGFPLYAPSFTVCILCLFIFSPFPYLSHMISLMLLQATCLITTAKNISRK